VGVGRFERWFFFLGGGAKERRVVPLLVRIRDREMGVISSYRGRGCVPRIGNSLAALQGWLPETEIGRFLIAL